MAVHPIGPLRDIDTLDAATNRKCATGSRLPPPCWFQPRVISAQLSHARISAPSSTESYDIIYITFCDANQERHRNATQRSCAQIESYLLRSGRTLTPVGEPPSALCVRSVDGQTPSGYSV